MLSKTAAVAAGVSGMLGFIGYCIYFDRKRRSDPKFKQNLRNKRAKALLLKEQAKKSISKLPDVRDPESLQNFFLQELQLGEKFLGQGDIENGIEHLSTAIALYSEPSNLLEVLSTQLPPQVFGLLMQRLPIVSQRLASSFAAQTLQDGDVE